MMREHVANPVVVAQEGISGLDVVIDLPLPGQPLSGTGDAGDPGSAPAVTALSGSVELSEVEFGDEFLLGSIGKVLVYATSLDFTGGPWGARIREGAGPFATQVRDSRGEVALVAYFDRDDNGFFEPSDPLGVPLNNVFVLGEGDLDGIVIGIPTPPDEAVTLPAAYVQLHAEVLYDGFNTGDIHIFATAGSVAGVPYASLTVGAPVTFAMRVPAWTSDIYLWAVVDEDGDGQWELADDPNGVLGPLETEDGDLWDLDVVIGIGDSSATFSGTFSYAGAVGPSDQLWVTLLDADDVEAPPAEVELVSSPILPYSYSFAVESGRYFPAGYIDFGSDNPGGPADGEPVGTGAIITVSQGEVSTGNDVTLALP
jgi:hypothetical protein